VLEHTATDGLVLVSLLAGGGLAIIVSGAGGRGGGSCGLEHRSGGLESRSWSRGEGLHGGGGGCWSREALHGGGCGSVMLNLGSRSWGTVHLRSRSAGNLWCGWHIGPHWSGSRLSGIENWSRSGSSERSGSWSRSKGLNGSWS